MQPKTRFFDDRSLYTFPCFVFLVVLVKCSCNVIIHSCLILCNTMKNWQNEKFLPRQLWWFEFWVTVSWTLRYSSKKTKKKCELSVKISSTRGLLPPGVLIICAAITWSVFFSWDGANWQLNSTLLFSLTVNYVNKTDQDLSPLAAPLFSYIPNPYYEKNTNHELLSLLSPDHRSAMCTWRCSNLLGCFPCCWYEMQYEQWLRQCNMLKLVWS